MTEKTPTSSAATEGEPLAHPEVRTIFESPLLVSKMHFGTFLQCLRDAVEDEKFDDVCQASAMSRYAKDDDFWDDGDWMTRRYRPYKVKDGILTIGVSGALINKFSYKFGSWVTGYDYLERAVERGMADPNVRGIAFDINSPGGSAAGNFELVESIAMQRGAKPMRAYVNDTALSGGYSIATAADRIVTSRSGLTGSVGVVSAHVDLSKMLEEAGVKVSFVFAGKHKVDGNAYEPLSDSARERMQTSVDKYYHRFVSTVAVNRGIPYSAVRDTEALVFDSDESLDVKFADTIASFRTDMKDFAEISAHGGHQMSGTEQETKTEKEPEVDTAKVQADARAAERKRFADVQSSDEFKGREGLANKLLSTTEMTAEKIVEVLASAERKAETAPAQPGAEQPRNHFAETMDKNGTPGVGAAPPNGGEGGGEEPSARDKANAIFASAGYEPTEETKH